MTRGPSLPSPSSNKSQGKPLRKTAGCFVEEFIIILSIKFLEEGKSLLSPPSPLTAPPFTLTFFHS